MENIDKEIKIEDLREGYEYEIQTKPRGTEWKFSEIGTFVETIIHNGIVNIKFTNIKDRDGSQKNGFGTNTELTMNGKYIRLFYSEAQKKEIRAHKEKIKKQIKELYKGTKGENLPLDFYKYILPKYLGYSIKKGGRTQKRATKRKTRRSKKD